MPHAKANYIHLYLIYTFILSQFNTSLKHLPASKSFNLYIPLYSTLSIHNGFSQLSPILKNIFQSNTLG